MLDERRAYSHESVPRPQERDCRLVRLTTVLNGLQEFWVQAGDSCQVLRIRPVRSPGVLPDRENASRVCNENLEL